MEKAMQILYQTKYCLNCGTWFNIKVNRFPVCKCGCTEAVGVDDRRGTVEPKSGILSVVIGRERITTYRYDDYADIIPALYNLPIVNSSKVKEVIMEPFTNEEKAAFVKEKCWVVLSHLINMIHSPLYRELWNERLFRLCKCIIYEGIPHTKTPTAGEIEKIKMIPEAIPDELLVLAMDNILSGLDEETAVLLGLHGISSYDYNTLQEKYNLTDDQLSKDIRDYAILAFRGNDIIERIDNYYDTLNWFKDNLKEEKSLVLNSNDPIYIRSLFAENKKRVLINSGEYAIKKCMQKYASGEFEKYIGHISMRNGLIIRAATIDEVGNNMLIAQNIPKEGLNSPPHVIVNDNGNIDSVVFVLNDGSVGIDGVCDDEHKILANTYLDSFK